MFTASWLQEIHQRLLAEDPTATAELFEAIFEPLKRALIKRNPQLKDDEIIDDAMTDALFAYVKVPEKYDPEKAGLFGYLEMAAQGDLLNALAKRRRRLKKVRPLTLVDLEELDGKIQTDGVEIEIKLEAKRIQKRIAQLFDDPKDLEMAELIIAKERSTESFADILGIKTLPIAEQRREVKRHKDRIKKQLKQLGERIRDE